MATYKSQAILRANRFRAPTEGRVDSVGWAITIPSGTLIASGDTIRLGRVDPGKIIPKCVLIDFGGNLDGHATPASRTLAGTLGYLKSANRAGTNLSVNAAGSAATESAAGLLAAATAPTSASTGMTSFGTAGAAGLLSTGGAGIFPVVTTSGLVDSRGYDANVMDVAITFTANSSTATTADIVIACTLEYFGVMTAPSSAPSYLYGD